MQTTNRLSSVFDLIDALPSDFHEVHGHRPRLGFDGFTLDGDIPAWLDRMHAACADSAQAHLRVFEAIGERDLVDAVRQYLAVTDAIQALRTA